MCFCLMILHLESTLRAVSDGPKSMVQTPVLCSRRREKEQASHGVNGVNGVFSCRFLRTVRRRVRGERRHGAPVDEARAGVGPRERERDGRAAGGHENFFEGNAVHRILSKAHRNRTPAPPDARSGEPSARSAIEGSGKRRGGGRNSSARPGHRPLCACGDAEGAGEAAHHHVERARVQHHPPVPPHVAKVVRRQGKGDRA